MKDSPYIIANWKLGLDYTSSCALANKIVNGIEDFVSHGHIVICPSATSLEYTSKCFRETPIHVGVQHIFSEQLGSFTGETSVLSAQQLGARYVIIGHSERRKYFHETDADVAKKTKLVLEHSLIPIICVGETYEARQSGKAELIVRTELKEALSEVKPTNNQPIIIAYEPVWAIGTGQAIHPDQARLMAMVIHQMLVDMFPEELLHNFSVVYGGSVDAQNVKSFVDGRIIKGVLVGGASQNFDDFHSLVLALGKQ